MKIYSDVFNSQSELIAPAAFRACFNAHGLYHSRQFVLRLSPINHGLLKDLKGRRTASKGEIDDRTLQAYSTYIHENIHWWQHKGSISGFVRSAAFPAFSHVNLNFMKELTALIGPIKPLYKWWDAAQRSGIYAGTRIEFLCNSIINNFIDVEFYIAQTYNPEGLRDIALDPYFECAAHSAWITYAQVVSDISGNSDKSKIIFPDTEAWEDKFLDCRQREVPGHYYGSEIRLAPVGLLDILEGQARMIQLQYLGFARGGLSLATAREQNFLNGEYGRAFDFFLKQIEVEEPVDVLDPLIALFLIICDIALNPHEGFIRQIENYESFQNNTDPGYRFTISCSAVAVDLPHLKRSIIDYSKEEYISTANAICNACGYMSPHEIAVDISTWKDRSPEISRLMNEHSTTRFLPPNPVTRILLAEFISFSADKAAYPHFFCWPGAYMAGSKMKEEHNILWLRHLALFSDQADTTTIVPRQIIGSTNDAVNEAFNNFYGGVMSYDFMRQWILGDGEFDIDFNWLIELDDVTELRAEIAKHILRQFGVNPQDFTFVDIE